MVQVATDVYPDPAGMVVGQGEGEIVPPVLVKFQFTVPVG
jgi:hypothetical protein